MLTLSIANNLCTKQTNDLIAIKTYSRYQMLDTLLLKNNGFSQNITAIQEVNFQVLKSPQLGKASRTGKESP